MCRSSPAPLTAAQSLVSLDRAIELLNVVGVICSACVPSAMASVAISLFSIVSVVAIE